MTGRSLLDITFIRFLLVGGGIAFIYSGISAALVRLLPFPAPGIAVAVWIACIGPAFWCQRRFTFAARAPHRHALALYAATQVSGMVIVAVASALFATRMIWWDMMVYLTASVVAAVISYTVNMVVIFAPMARATERPLR